MAMPHPTKGVDGRTYLPFYSSKYAFSNFFPSKFTVDGVEYSTVEQYFQQQKALAFKDTRIAAWIVMTNKPKEAKYLGRRVSGFNPSVWEDQCMDIMFRGVYEKFSQNHYLCMKLISYFTDGVPVECSPSDHLWGVGLPLTDPRVLDPRQRLGLNRLGRIISDVRKEISTEFAEASYVE